MARDPRVVRIPRAVLTCSWHAAHFDVRSGKVYQETPRATDTETFPVTIEGDDVFVDL